MAGKNDKWCFTWLAQQATGPGASRAALLKAAKWQSGDDLMIAFLDGDPALQKRVANTAKLWTDAAAGGAKLNLVFQNDLNTALIRISFKYSGSWSTIGTTCRQITDKTQPTMNYGWLTKDSTDAEIRQVVLHEFGHALGLIHEHQNPKGVIHWNRERVINDLSGYPNYWDLDTIERNMFQAYAREEVNATKLDEKSIMMYSFPKEWTTDGFSAPINYDLSADDRKLIQKEYS